jgi:hypothetical protein
MNGLSKAAIYRALVEPNRMFSHFQQVDGLNVYIPEGKNYMVGTSYLEETAHFWSSAPDLAA